MLQHILIDAQRDLLFHSGHRVLTRRRCRSLGGGFLEGGLRLGTRIVQRARAARWFRHDRDSLLLERFRAKWIPVRVKKTRQSN
jgi:hypothetical protein